MRDPNRIEPFMKALGQIWKENCPDWRFGQLMFNVQRVLQSHGTDIFYMEDDKLLEYFREWFDVKPLNNKDKKNGIIVRRCRTCKEPLFEDDIRERINARGIRFLYRMS